MIAIEGNRDGVVNHRGARRMAPLSTPATGAFNQHMHQIGRV